MFVITLFLGNELEDSLRASLAKNENELERIFYSSWKRIFLIDHRSSFARLLLQGRKNFCHVIALALLPSVATKRI